MFLNIIRTAIQGVKRQEKALFFSLSAMIELFTPGKRLRFQKGLVSLRTLPKRHVIGGKQQEVELK